MIVVFLSFSQTVFTVLSRVVPGYESSGMMISAQMLTENRVLVVPYFVTVVFLTSFFCVRNVGETLLAK